MPLLKNPFKWLQTDNMEKLHGGPLRCEVLAHDRSQRFRAMRMLDPAGKCCLLALTQLNTPAWDEETCRVDDLIAQGGFIGRTLRDTGLDPLRNLLATLTWALPKGTQELLGVSEPLATVWLVRLTIHRPGKPRFPYGDTFEIYHPDDVPPGAQTPCIHFISKSLQAELNGGSGKIVPNRLEELWRLLGQKDRRFEIRYAI
ncbi:MAG: hypothetical protein KGJ13_05585 [Patescibacteria group bacterium]|nr:hypothetical protein [Patescibacteria group bacterium]